MAKPNRISEQPPLTLEDEAKLDALRADIEIAYQQVLAGDLVDGEEVFAELFSLYGKPPSED
ncbi:hypothetical protein [Azospirillum sp. sgz301742]